MISFQTIRLCDREQIAPILRRANRQNSEYTFTNLYLWGRQQFAVLDGSVVVFAHWYGHSDYLYPAGDTYRRHVIELLIGDAHERGIPLRLTGLNTDDATRLSEDFPGRFFIRPWRDSFDYIYNIEDLASLKGRKYQQKRNHINRFLAENDDWRMEPLTTETLDACRAMSDEWYRQHAERDEHADFYLEKQALNRALDAFDALGMEGLVLRSGGRIVAFTMGNLIRSDTFDVNFEKAYADVQGAYAIINREFARRLQQKYPALRYLNREDDMGIPGLRQAKLSYHPAFMVEKSRATLIEER